jgi:hypothetical protein
MARWRVLSGSTSVSVSSAEAVELQAPKPLNVASNATMLTMTRHTLMTAPV